MHNKPGLFISRYSIAAIQYRDTFFSIAMGIAILLIASIDYGIADTFLEQKYCDTDTLFFGLPLKIGDKTPKTLIFIQGLCFLLTLSDQSTKCFLIHAFTGQVILQHLLSFMSAF